MTWTFCVGLTAACGQRVDEEAAPASGASLAVSYGNESVLVYLSRLTTVDVGGTALVPLEKIAGSALPALALSDVRVSFRAGDGFDPASSSNCQPLLPLAGAKLAQGYVDPATRNLSWDAALGYPGCMKVRDLAEILVADAP